MSVRIQRAAAFTSTLALLLALVPVGVSAQPANTAGNAACPGEDVFYNPSRGEDIVVPEGYRVEVFARDLNMPTAVEFQGTASNFRVFVLESGTGLPGRCNNSELPAFGGKFSANNPFTPDMLVFDNGGRKLAGPLGKPTSGGGGFQPDGPAIGLAFENGFQGGRLFATDSNQGVRGAPGRGNNTSRILTVDPSSGNVSPFITGLPTGDHPTEQVIVKDGWIYWSQGSATNAGVTGHDNGAGGNQHEIACQNITLSDNVWDSGDGHRSSGYSNHGITRPGAQVPAFEDATKPGMCSGAILRARADAPNPADTIQPFSWGYRNPMGIRFAPVNHPLAGGLLVTENGEDERGARPTNGSPDRLQLARQNPDGSPDWHGWPDWFGGVAAGDGRFTPIGGPADDNPEAMVGRAVKPVLKSPPQQPVGPLALEPTGIAAVGTDFAPDSFVQGVVRRGAALVSREGDFGFSPPAPEPGGHDVELVNFNSATSLEQSRFAFNCPQASQTHSAGGAPGCTAEADQAFVDQLRGINRPVTAMFGPDGALYVVDYGAVRDFGRSDPESKFLNDDDAPLVIIPHTGVVWKISRIQAAAPAPAAPGAAAPAVAPAAGAPPAQVPRQLPRTGDAPDLTFALGGLSALLLLGGRALRRRMK